MSNLSKKTKLYSLYGKERLDALNLTAADGFRIDQHGNIVGTYYSLDNEPYLIDKADSRTTKSIECPEKWRNKKPYTFTRFAPEFMPISSDGKPAKYLRPGNENARPFFPLQLRQLYNSDAICPMVIFTEGEQKAAYIAKNFGIMAIGFGGISQYKLCPETRIVLRKEQPPVIVLNYDNDGRNSDNLKRLAAFFASAFNMLQELRAFYLLERLTMPLFYVCIQSEKQPHKGIDDLLQAEGMKAAAEFRTLRSSKYFTFAKIDFDNLYNDLSTFFGFNSKKYKVKEKNGLITAKYLDKDTGQRTRLTDILKTNKIPLETIFNKIWSVPTGTGKTTTIAHAAHKNKVVFLVPTKALRTQVYFDVQKLRVSVFEYTGNHKERECFADIMNAGELPQMVVCTFASAASLCRMLGSKTALYNLVIDEFHNTTAAANPAYMLKQLNEVLDSAKLYKTITGLTGTPLLNCHPITAHLQTIEVKLSGKPKIPTEIIQAIDIIKAAAIAIERSISLGRLPIVLYNNKKDGLEDLKALLPAEKLQAVRTFNADTKENTEFCELLDTGYLDNAAKGVISTTVLKEGVNICNEQPTDIVIIGNHHPTTIAQFTARLRRADVHLYIIHKKTTEPIKARYIDAEAHAAKAIKQAQQICDLLAISEPEDSILDIRATIQSPYIRKTESGFVPDYLAIQNAIFEQQAIWANSTPERLFEALKPYDFEKVSQRDCLISRTDLEQADSKIRKANKKAEKVAAFDNVLKVLKAAPLPQLEAQKLAGSKNTPATDRDFYNMFLDIREHCKTDAQALELMKQTEGKQAKAKQAIFRLKTKRANFESHALGNAPTAILRDFAHGQRLTIEQLKDKFLDCLRTDKTINLEPYEKAQRIDRILKKLRIFFDVVPSKDGKEYRIKNLSSDYQ